MKNNYTLKTLVMTVFVALLYVQTFAQIRVVRVDPTTNEVTIRNYGSPNNPENIGPYWLCNFPDYDQLEDMVVLDGNLNLAIGSEVTVTSTVNFPVADAELGLYNDNDFGSATAMQDYLQWGSSGHPREGVANTANLWTPGTFIADAPPFEYTGNGSQNGVGFWQTALSIDGFEAQNAILMFPNPTTNMLNIKLASSVTNASISIFDMLGKTVMSQIINTSNALDVSKLVSGLYLVKIQTNQGLHTRRFVKQ